MAQSAGRIGFSSLLWSTAFLIRGSQNQRQCAPSSYSLSTLNILQNIGLLLCSFYLTLKPRSIRAEQPGVAEKITLTHGDAAQLATLFEAGSFGVVLCHNILEYVDDPCAVLRCAARLLRDEFGIISILVRNQAGEVLKAALQDGNLAAAEHNLAAEWGNEALYGGRVRLFAEKSLETVLVEASLAVTAQRGVRVLSDYLPPRISRNDEYERILGLERKLARRPEFAAIARYTHCLAHRTAPVMKDGR